MIKTKIQTNREIVECVINVSEGRDHAKLDQIKKLLSRPGLVHVLHVDIGYDAHRTVFTLAGIIEEVFRAVEELIKFAALQFDINNHMGTHPRIGIIDVIPFVALQNIKREKLIKMTKAWAKKMADTSKIPIFFYGHLSNHTLNRSLHDLRKGGLPRLSKSIGTELIADCGPQYLHDKLGASALTVRDFMVAFNINLSTDDIFEARKLSSAILSKRASYKEGEGLDIRNVKFLAWSAPKYQCCQISSNIYDIQTVKMLSLYRYVSNIAASMGIKVLGSELIGLAPISAICSKSVSMDDALKELMLDSVRSFKKDEQILELQLSKINWRTIGHQ